MDVSSRLPQISILQSKEKQPCYIGPGSFLEVRKILPLLTSAPVGQPNFHVVALSLPGFGFSEAPTKKGFGAAQYAEVICLFVFDSMTT
jgi:hypothetical protein